MQQDDLSGEASRKAYMTKEEPFGSCFHLLYLSMSQKRGGFTIRPC